MKPRTHSLRRAVAALLATAGVLVSTGSALADQTVATQATAFAPQTVRIGVREKVIWANGLSAGSHTATADGGSFDTGPIGPGQQASITFVKAGTFAYSCLIVPTMKGTVVVLDAAPSASPPASTSPTATKLPSSAPTTRPSTGSPPPTDGVADLDGGSGGSGSAVLLGMVLLFVGVAFALVTRRRPAGRSRSAIRIDRDEG